MPRTAGVCGQIDPSGRVLGDGTPLFCCKPTGHLGLCFSEDIWKIVSSFPVEAPREVPSMQPIEISEDSLEESCGESEEPPAAEEPAEEPAEEELSALPKPRKHKVCGTPSPSKTGFCTQPHGHLGPCFLPLARKRQRV
jgi:hypothetical protein